MKYLSKRLLKRQPRQKVSNVDKWLKRLNNLSQFGLLILAVFGYFYTVIPVYQKSLLDEQIAQKETQLKSMQTKLDEMYIEIRMNAVKELLLRVSYRCAGIDKLPKDAFENFSNKTPNIRNKLREVFEIDLKECLVDTFYKSKKIKESLKESDYQALLTNVNSVYIKLSSTKEKLVNRFDSLPEDAKLNPKILNPLKSGFGQMALEYKKPLISEEEYKNKLFEERVNQALSDIRSEYNNQVSKEIFSLKDIQWPNE